MKAIKRGIGKFAIVQVDAATRDQLAETYSENIVTQGGNNMFIDLDEAWEQEAMNDIDASLITRLCKAGDVNTDDIGILILVS
jgi:hypothetical protein